MVDFLIVGAGFAGAVLAERLAVESGQHVTVIDKRDHIAGNAYDHLDAAGVLVHKYGPHIFHTNSSDVFEYLSRFTTWRKYEHRVLTQVDGKLLPMPINLTTLEKYFECTLDEASAAALLAGLAVPSDGSNTSEDYLISRIGRELYEKFFRNYTIKQWGLDPSQLDASVAARVPMRLNRDDRYFTDDLQYMPSDGYTRMFERMLSNPRIDVQLGTDFREAAARIPHRKLIYTGPIDEYFDFRFGKLPYRSLQFEHETLATEQFQDAAVVNYPNEHPYTRITEFKYLTGQKHALTSIVREIPAAEGEPYYPVPNPANADLYHRYRQLAERETKTTFVGRLANYRYFNMDQVVAQSLKTYRQLRPTLVHPISSPNMVVPGRVSPTVSAATLSSKTGSKLPSSRAEISESNLSCATGVSLLEG